MVETLARLQFAVTVLFHYLFAPTTVGLSVILVAIEGMYLKTHDTFLKKSAQLLSKILGLIFIFGVATGIVLEFEFGTNMASFSQFANEVFAGPLLAEGLVAFFLESIFLGIVLYGWDRVSEKIHFFSTLMVCLGSHLSVVWIVIANSWMQTPQGFTITQANGMPHAQITNYWAMLCNPSSPDMIIHTMLGAHLAGAFFVASLCAYYLLKGSDGKTKWMRSGSSPILCSRFAMIGLKISLIFAGGILTLQLVSGDSSARCVARVNPEKLAAFEGIYHTTQRAPLSFIGLPNTAEETVDYQVAIPGLLSLLAFHDSLAEVRGLDMIPKEDWPNVGIVFQSYHLMIIMWGLMTITVFLGWIYFNTLPKGQVAKPATALHEVPVPKDGSISTNPIDKATGEGLPSHYLIPPRAECVVSFTTPSKTRWILRLLFISALFPQIANATGWIATEMGRYPWAIYKVLRIQDSISKTVGLPEVACTLAIYVLLYALLLHIFIRLLSRIVYNPGLADE